MTPYKQIADIVKIEIMESIYPVGTIYISTSNINPKNLFGGEWEQLKDRFLLSAGDIYTAGDTGGEATHKLTIDETPKHKHSMTHNILYDKDSDTAWYSIGFVGRNGASDSIFKQKNYTNNNINDAGGDQPHNNMPPYLVVYMWKRTK